MFVRTSNEQRVMGGNVHKRTLYEHFVNVWEQAENCTNFYWTFDTCMQMYTSEQTLNKHA